jgi:hypothetical protein
MEQNEIEKLEEAANEFAGSWTCSSHISEGFKAGAEWQKQQSQSSDGGKTQKAIDLGTCRNCDKVPATKDYNGHQHYVCDRCYKNLNDYFDEEYR